MDDKCVSGVKGEGSAERKHCWFINGGSVSAGVKGGETPW